MSDEAFKAFTQVATLCTSLVTLLIAVLSLLSSRKNKAKLSVLHDQINGQQDLLLKATGARERAAGLAEGRQAGIAERADRVAEEERVEDRAEKKLN